MKTHRPRLNATDLSALQARAEAMLRGDFSAMGNPVSEDEGVENLRRALDVIGAHLQQANANAEDYIAGLIRSQESERERLSRELHDDAVQRLIALGQDIDRVSLGIEIDSSQASAELGELRHEVNDLVRALREVIVDLHPPILDEVGWIPALQMLFSRGGKSAPKVNFTIEGSEHLIDSGTAMAIYRIAQEAWSNVLRHAHATTVNVNLVFAEDGLRITMRDDGKGFEPASQVWRAGETASLHGWGIKNMHERAEIAGGRLHLISAPAEGTTVFLQMSYAKNLVQDPVCGMKIGSDAISVLYKGANYYFCSDACKDLFQSQPDHFASSALSTHE
jgi:signal transduction histidine kinase/YHS domain-containing protein